MRQGIYIVGAGGNGRVCAEVAECMGISVLGFIDSPRHEGERVNGKSIPFRSLRELHQSGLHAEAAVFIAASRNVERVKQCEEARALGFQLPTLIHPSAVISPSCSIGEATVVMPGVIVNANTRVGRSCILNTACSVDHDSVVEDGAQICPGVHAASTVHYGEQCFVGTGASIKQLIRIGARAVIGAGSVVIRDVAADVTVVGNPARVVRAATA